MSKRKDESPFEDGASYREILGVDPAKIHEKVRRDQDVAGTNLLTSTDLFGDIIEEFETVNEAGPKTPEPAQDEARPAVRKNATLEAQRADTDPFAESEAAREGASILEAAYSTLLEDADLNRDVSALDRSAKADEDDGSDYGSYVLLDRVAAGGMAEVFRAKRKGVEGFEKVVAVKRILPHLSSNQDFVEMFIAEAKMVASLTHPNIAQIFDLGKIEDTYYIAMEFVEGKDLRAILSQARKQEKAFPVDLVALVAARICAALEYAHRHRDDQGNELRIVHRDVSPQNILVSNEGEVKLVDFGIARAATKASHTDSGTLRGKLLYMSPEQAWGKPLDHRSDIFSLGSVLYEALAGRPLFSATSDMGILERVRQGNFVPASAANPAVPIEINAVLTRALSRNPEDRYQDAGEMLLDLDTFLRRRPAVGPASLASFVEQLFAPDPSS